MIAASPPATLFVPPPAASVQPPLAAAFMIRTAAEKLVLTITSDGVVKLGDGATADDAARIFVDALQGQLKRLLVCPAPKDPPHDQ